MAAGLEGGRNRILVITDGSDAHVIGRPFSANQFQRLICKLRFIPGLFLTLGVIKHEGLKHVIKFRGTFYPPSLVSQCLYVLCPFHVIFYLKNLIENFIRKWLRRLQG